MDIRLIIEGSCLPAIVGISRGEEVVQVIELDSHKQRSSDLVIAIQQLFRTVGATYSQCSEVICGLGPGSYTGLRVTLSAVKAMVYATGARFAGIESFVSWIPFQHPDPHHVAVIDSALKEKLFYRNYLRNSEGNWLLDNDLEIITGEESALRLSHADWITGPEAIRRQKSNPVPSIDRLKALVAATRIYPQLVHTDVWLAEPLYLRGSSAEENVKKA
ncbi:MAG: tRNA (adenosine(37)-N6)-threonylcarbamoyltransferase complex dimerization subunit type 1 TsaB [Zavarzinella sp.]